MAEFTFHRKQFVRKTKWGGQLLEL
jgi:hypothetical protein